MPDYQSGAVVPQTTFLLWPLYGKNKVLRPSKQVKILQVSLQRHLLDYKLEEITDMGLGLKVLTSASNELCTVGFRIVASIGDRLNIE